MLYEILYFANHTTRKVPTMKFRPFAETKYILLLIILLSIIAILFKSIYRLYIYANQINDFGIADSSTNFFAGLIITFMYFVQFQNYSLKKHTVFVIVGLVGYELIQGTLFKNNVFDYKDIIASILGALIGYVICVKMKSLSVLNYKHVKGTKVT